MARPTVPALIQFGVNANPASEIGQFGSYASPNYSNNLTTLMSGTMWPRGWFAETINTNRPFIQDFNCVDFVLCSYLFYLLTLGVPEYIAAMTYWTNSIIQVAGQFYLSLVDNNTGNTPATSPTQWQPGIPGMEMSGVIKAWAGVVAPSGYLLCQGQAVSRTTYASLFNVCGTNYGAGDGSTTFNIPNLQGRVPVGLLTGDPNFGTIGKVGGESSHTLIVSEIPSHTHTIGAIISTAPGGSGLNDLFTGSGVSTGSTGGDAPHNNIQPYQVINYIIKT